MFNNIIYFIIVLLIFSINYPQPAPQSSLLFSMVMLCMSWVVFAGYCRTVFRDLRKGLDYGSDHESRLVSKYHGLVARLSVLAIFFFALAVYFYNIKYWIQMIPGFERLSVLQGIFALSLFFFYLCTIWYFGHPEYEVIFQTEITRRSFIRSNLKLNIPILFPWIFLSLVYDLISLSPLSGSHGFFDRIDVQIIFFAIFLTILMIFMPGFIRYFWGCEPLNVSEKGRQLEGFLRDQRFKCRDILTWPIFEGRMMTAGIMGIVPRFRYILVTDTLMDMLSVEELKAVLAHEMGHAKYRHFLFYVLFFVGFMALSFGLFDLSFYFFYAHPFFVKIISDTNPQGTNLFYLILSIPMLLSLLIYFRYIMGFFMRNFERQADLYSATVMGTPGPTIRSLEKIALFGGKIRDLPSWHHFSIRERVDTLLRTLREPGLIRRHNRFVVGSFLIYLVLLGGLTYLLNFSNVKQNMGYNFIVRLLNQQILDEPENIAPYLNLAMIYHEAGRHMEAINTYEKIIDMDPQQAPSLNNLAWLLVTTPKLELRNKERALNLAKKAVALETSSVFLDTLAEAYYANGLTKEAVITIEKAIAIATKDKGYYKRQLKKFLSAEASS